MKKSVKFSPEVREHAVRMVAESRADHPSQWSAVKSIAAKIGCTPQTLLTWVRQHERDSGQRYIPPAEAEANYYRKLADQAAILA
jgi:transposase